MASKIIKYAYQLFRGIISKIEFVRLLTNSAIIITFFSAMHHIGAGGILTAIFGAISSVVIAGTALLVNAGWFDQFSFTDEDIKSRLLSEALIYFSFMADDVKDPQIFNSQTVRKRFHRLAKLMHPDGNEVGSAELYIVLQGHYGILLGAAEEIKTEEEQNISLALEWDYARKLS